MAYYNDNSGTKIKNLKFQRLIFKFSAFSSLACFLTLFVGAINNNRLTEVIDSKNGAGSSSFRVLTSDNQKNVEIIRKDKNFDIQTNDVINCSDVGGKKTYIIDRAIKLNVSVRGAAPLSVETPPKITVEKALCKADISLDEHDVLNVERNAVVSDGMEIKIDKIEFKNVSEEVDVPFKTVEIDDNNKASGAVPIREVNGQNGKLLKTFEIKVVNGKDDENSKKLIKEEMIVQPVDKIVFKVKKVSGASTNKSNRNGASNIVPCVFSKSKSNDPNYSKEIICRATAYGPTGRSTSSGRPAVPYHSIAVKKNNKLNIQKNATGDIYDDKTGRLLAKDVVVEDTLPSTSHADIDVCVKSEKSAKKDWGVKTVKFKLH